MYSIFYLMLGIVVAFAIPLSLLRLAIWFADKTDKKDKCVLCGKDTPYKQSVSVKERKHYVKGAGQMCENCYNDTYRFGE